MTDSDVHEALAAKHEANRERRIEAIKRWVRYIEREPPDVWSPQQNAVVDDQLEAARAANTSPDYRQHVRSVAEDIVTDDDPVR
jgi:hypothetical protein